MGAGLEKERKEDFAKRTKSLYGRPFEELSREMAVTALKPLHRYYTFNSKLLLSFGFK